MAEKPKEEVSGPETEKPTISEDDCGDFPFDPPASEPWVRALKLISSSWQDEGSVVEHQQLWIIEGNLIKESVETREEMRIHFRLSENSFSIGSNKGEWVYWDVPMEYRHVLTSLREDMARHRTCQLLKEVGQD